MKYIAIIVLIVSGFFLTASILLCLGIMPMESYNVPIVLLNTVEYDSSVEELVGLNFSGLILFIVSLLIFSSVFSYYRVLTRVSRKKNVINKEDVTRPYILYLRSFSDEKSTKKIISRLTDYRSEEEMLTDALSDIAPVYAIGDPADKKMPYGATRIYVDDAIWKSTVTDLALNAEIVVLRLGKTNNFWWEVEMALKQVPIEKIVFVIPWSKNFNNISTLFKILLEHNIDISSLDIAIDKKRFGSISSVLYFNDKKEPACKEIFIPRFTGMFLSYDNLLRNALSGFRARYGFKTQKKSPVLKSRIFTLALLLIAIICCGGRFMGQYAELKYQRPYELVEECVKDQDFVSKYGTDINGTNLTWSIVGSFRGKLLLPSNDFILMSLIEDKALLQMSVSETEAVNDAPYNILLMIKKYAPEDYEEYIQIASTAALFWVKYPEQTNSALEYYKNNFNNLPQWVNDFFSQYMDVDEETFETLWAEEIDKHINDADIADVIKTIIAQNINPE